MISQAYLTIFAVAAIVILLQVALTRIVSATASYHSAYVVLSVVMLGISASALAVYRDTSRYSSNQHLQCAVRYLIFAGTTTVIALFGYLLAYRAGFFESFAFGYALLASLIFFPTFYFCGYCVAYLLNRYSDRVGQLYWYDLLGAAVGCLVTVILLNLLGAINVILLCALVLVACSFRLRLIDAKQPPNYLHTLVALLVVLFSGLYILIPAVQLKTVPDRQSEFLLLKEDWNSLAKIAVYRETSTLDDAIGWFLKKNPEDLRSPDYLKRLFGSGWGLSTRYSGAVADHYYLDLDSGASTIIIGAGSAKAEDLEFLRWDVTAIAYNLIEDRINTRTFIIGGGGGRDILTANVFGVEKIDVVELNAGVVATVEESFGAFSGGPYNLENVTLTLGEARSVLQRSTSQYDLIQMSMIDTFAATSSGAFVLAENNLYTTEAVTLYLQKLKENGVLSISRWYSPEYLGELGKTLAIVREALHGMGVVNPNDHVVVIYNHGYLPQGVASFLIKKEPFTALELQKLRSVAEQMSFSMLWPNRESESRLISNILQGKTQIVGSEEFDFRASTDNWPFFFNTKRPFYSWYMAFREGDLSLGSTATLTMVTIILVLLFAAVRLIYRPLRSISRQFERSYHIYVMTRYFASIGLGFMVIEIGLLQRYIHFLGHPTYALTVVLFSILLFAGIGSLLSPHFSSLCQQSVRRVPIILAISGGLFSAFILPEIVEHFFYFNLWIRIFISVVCIAPFALAMGMIFPLGVSELIHLGKSNLMPLMWGVNGIFSVFGSIIGMWVAISFGYTTVFLFGSISYLVTFFSTNWNDQNLSESLK